MIMNSGLFLAALGYFFMGPDPALTGLKPNLYCTCSMSIFIAFGLALVVIPILPEMLDEVRGVYPGDEEAISQICSAIFTFSYYLGSFVGLLLAGVLVE